MTKDQQKMVVEVLQESASTARRAFHRYVSEDPQAPAAPAFLIYARAYEAGIVSVMALTLEDA